MSENETTTGEPNDESALVRVLRLTQPRPQAPAAVEAAVRASVRDEWQRVTRARRRRLPMLAAAITTALAASLLIWIGGIWPAAPLDPAGSVLRATGTVRMDIDGDGRGWLRLESDDIAPGSRLATDAGSRAALRLANGANVRLDHGTEIGIEAADRLSLERGRIYIDTHRPGSAGGSVRVHTSRGIISDVGTQFEIAYVDETVRVRVREGAVLVDREAGHVQGRRGEEVAIRPDGGVERARVETFGEHWSWVEEIAPSFEIDGRTAIEFLAWIARETGRELEFVDRSSEEAARITVLHGSVQGFTPGEALVAVLATTRLRRVEDDRLLLIEARGLSGPP